MERTRKRVNVSIYSLVARTILGQTGMTVSSQSTVKLNCESEKFIIHFNFKFLAVTTNAEWNDILWETKYEIEMYYVARTVPKQANQQVASFQSAVSLLRLTANLEIKHVFSWLGAMG